MSADYMPWRCVKSPNCVTRLAIGLALLLFCCLAAPSAYGQRAFLVTYGVGEASWEWFGHNAIWLEDPQQGLNHVYSFGYFNFDDPGFYWRFIRGDMKYFGSSSDVGREMAFYRQSNRSIRVQELALTESQFFTLQALLTEAIYPFPQYYDYNYFTANCSTWLRDILSETYGETFVSDLQNTESSDTYRSLTLNATVNHPLASVGLSMLLGPAADQKISAWESAFLPVVLADSLETMQINGEPIVRSDVIVFRSGADDVVQDNQPIWLGSASMAGVGLLSVMAILWLGGLGQTRRLWPSVLGLTFLSLLGVVLIFMGYLTSHSVVRNNHLLLIAHPLWLGLTPIFGSTLQKWSWWACVLLTGLALLWSIGLWGTQDRALSAMLLPIAVTLLWVRRQVADISLRSSA